jgi:hypothetical protein
MLRAEGSWNVEGKAGGVSGGRFITVDRCGLFYRRAHYLQFESKKT